MRCIYISDGKRRSSLAAAARRHGLETKTVQRRYHRGVRGDALFAPSRVERELGTGEAWEPYTEEELYALYIKFAPMTGKEEREALAAFAPNRTPREVHALWMDFKKRRDIRRGLRKAEDHEG